MNFHLDFTLSLSMAHSGGIYKINKRPKDDIDDDIITDKLGSPKSKTGSSPKHATKHATQAVQFGADIMETVISEDAESAPEDTPNLNENNSSFSFSHTKNEPHARIVSFHEMQGIQEEVHKLEEERKFQPKKGDIYLMGRKMTVIRGLISSPRELTTEQSEQYIHSVCLIVVVDAEIRPIMEKYKFEENEILTEQFMNLGVVSSGDVGSLHLDVIKVAESKVT